MSEAHSGKGPHGATPNQSPSDTASPAGTSGHEHRAQPVVPAPAADPRAGHGQSSTAAAPGPTQAPKVIHARTEYGPGADMRVDMPRTHLETPA